MESQQKRADGKMAMRDAKSRTLAEHPHQKASQRRRWGPRGPERKLCNLSSYFFIFSRLVSTFHPSVRALQRSGAATVARSFFRGGVPRQKPRNAPESGIGHLQYSGTTASC